MGQYEDSLGKDHPVIARVVTENQLAAQRGHEQTGVIFQRQGMTMGQSIAAEGTLYESGIPWFIPFGDGGSNGLSFTGTNAKFTLSAAVLTNFWNFFKAPSGGYIYLPAGSGGLTTGGWYFFRMTTDTDGEVFQEQYSGTGDAAIPASPTPHPNLTSGRITQVTTEVDGPSFILSGGSMGPNGIIRALVSHRTGTSASNRILKLKAGSTVIGQNTVSSGSFCTDLEFFKQNQGTQKLQSGIRVNAWLGVGGTSLLNDYTEIDFSVDQTITMSLQVAANTTSFCGWLREFTVKYGA